MLAQVGSYKAHIKNDAFDCAGCQGKQYACLLYSESVEVGRVGFPIMKINRGNYEKIFKAWERKAGTGFLELDVLLDFGLCPIPLFETEHIQAMDVFNLLDGVGKVNLPELFDYPGRYVEFCKMMMSARERADRIYIKAKKNGDS